jgi:hypothetical protein
MSPLLLSSILSVIGGYYPGSLILIEDAPDAMVDLE